MTARQKLKPLGEITSTTQFPSLTPLPTKPSVERLDTARKAAKKILTSYPDYGKAPPEYAINLAECLAFLTDEEISVVMHPRTGITAKTPYLPTNAEIQALLKEHEERKAKFHAAHTHYQRFKSVCTEKDAEPDKAPFRPYPKLWATFKDEPWLLKGHTFETLTEASRSFSMFGKDAARDVLTRKVGN